MTDPREIFDLPEDWELQARDAYLFPFFQQEQRKLLSYKLADRDRELQRLIQLRSYLDQSSSRLQKDMRKSRNVSTNRVEMGLFATLGDLRSAQAAGQEVDMKSDLILGIPEIRAWISQFRSEARIDEYSISFGNFRFCVKTPIWGLVHWPHVLKLEKYYRWAQGRDDDLSHLLPRVKDALELFGIEHSQTVHAHLTSKGSYLRGLLSPSNIEEEFIKCLFWETHFEDYFSFLPEMSEAFGALSSNGREIQVTHTKKGHDT